MFPIYFLYSMEDIPSCELLLNLFPLIKAIKAVQIFVLKFSKDGSADLGEEFPDGVSANQPVVQQEGVGLSSGQVSQCYCQFHSNF